MTEQSTSDNKKVLIVDDSRVSRIMIKAQISDAFPNWQLEEAGNAEQALTICLEQKFDYFSVDYNMPGMDGMCLIKTLQAKFEDARYVLLTANVQQALKEETQAMGVGLVNKPITEQSVAKMLEYFNE